MKAISLLTLFALASPLAAQNETKPVEKRPVQGQAKLLPNQQAFLNLPEESRKEFIKNLSDATRLFRDKRIFESMEILDKTEKIFADSPEIYNLRGSCLVEMRAFDKALVQFEKAFTYAKDNPSVEFNVAEVYFVTKEWKKSIDVFEKILKRLGPREMALSRLIEFKVLLCKKKLGLDDEAMILGEKYTFEDDSPYYYFAQAAIAYDKKDLVKAEEWLAMASRVFGNSNVIAPWQDTLVEYGYIKSFYGDDPAASAE